MSSTWAILHVFRPLWGYSESWHCGRQLEEWLEALALYLSHVPPLAMCAMGKSWSLSVPWFSYSKMGINDGGAVDWRGVWRHRWLAGVCHVRKRVKHAHSLPFCNLQCCLQSILNTIATLFKAQCTQGLWWLLATQIPQISPPTTPLPVPSPIREFWDASWAGLLTQTDAPSHCFRNSVVAGRKSGDLEVDVTNPLGGTCFSYSTNYHGSLWKAEMTSSVCSPPPHTSSKYFVPSISKTSIQLIEISFCWHGNLHSWVRDGYLCKRALGSIPCMVTLRGPVGDICWHQTLFQ